MHVPIDRSPLHRHTELHSNDAVSVAALLRSKDFELLLPRRAETDGAARINAIDLPNIHLCYVSYGTEAILTKHRHAMTIVSSCRWPAGRSL
jgi:hypothetical protein